MIGGQPLGLPDLCGVTLDGRYRIRREIARGAMGTVFEAQHAVLGRRLAVKVLHHRFGSSAIRQRFFHEARAAATISHEHVVQVLDFGLIEEAGSLPYFVMEYVDGETLEQRIARGAPLDPAEAVEIAAQMLCALEVLHGADLVHRDLKPANVIMQRTSRLKVFAKLVDFGVARAINPVWRRPDLTRVDQILGTPAYLSPEQASGGPPEPGWDLWAMGTILYEMLSGRLPFEVKSVEQVTADIAAVRLIPLGRLRPGLPKWLLEVVDRAQHPSLAKRFSTATALLEALDRRRAWPDGEVDARTTPFVRVDPVTPPPELIDALERPAAEPPPSVESVWDSAPTARHPREPAPAPAEATDRPGSAGSRLALAAVVSSAVVAGGVAVAAYLLLR